MRTFLEGIALVLLPLLMAWGLGRWARATAPQRSTWGNMTDIIIKDTHRGLWYEDGVLTRILEAGRYVLP